MSEDYYLVCQAKKIYMPVFSMVWHRVWVCHPDFINDFVKKAGSEEILFLHEQDERREACQEKDGYEFINSWKGITKKETGDA